MSAGPSTTDPASPALQVRSLSVAFRRDDNSLLRAVREVSYSVFPGQMLAIVGESGSGKSVSALCAPRLLPTPPAIIQGGQILLRDHPASPPIDILRAADHDLRAIRGGRIAMVFQEPMTSLNPTMRIGAQIAEAARAHAAVSRAEALALAEESLASVGIADPRARLRQYPHELSGGMRQRVMLAMALACRPRVLIADEPTTALDTTTQARVLGLIDEARRRHALAIVLITHSLGLARAHADTICVMWAGRVVEYGRAADVLRQPLHPYTRALLAAQPSLHTPQPRLGAPSVEPEPIANAQALPAWTPRSAHGVEPPPWRLARAGPHRWVGVSPSDEGAPSDEPLLPPLASLN